MPIIQVINSFLDNDYISFLLYHKEEKKESKSVSARFIHAIRAVSQTVLSLVQYGF